MSVLVENRLVKLLVLTVLAMVAPVTPAQAAFTADKTVMITGSNRGIGLGFVRHYVNQGWNVIATARRPEAAEDLKAIQADYPNLNIVQLDVTDHARIDALAAELAEQPIDVLINNAGIKPLTRGPEIDYDNARMMFEVNVWGAVKVAEAFMPHVKKSKDKKLVNLSSWLASIELSRAGAAMINYKASKAALNAYMVAMSHGTREDGVVTILIHPGVVNVRQDAPCADLDKPAAKCAADDANDRSIIDSGYR